jgi:hypothetical protein
LHLPFTSSKRIPTFSISIQSIPCFFP